MIARHRGDHSLHSRWRPQQPPAQHTDVETVDQQPVVENPELHDPVLDPTPPRRSRSWPTAAVVLLLALGAVAITSNSGSRPAPTSTPTGWIDTYMAWSLRSPERACTQLLTPALRRLLADGNGGSCIRAYTKIRNTPFRIMRILQDGSTAAVELHWLPNVGYSTILLNQRGGVWQAVDMIPGGQVIPRRHAHRSEKLGPTLSGLETDSRIGAAGENPVHGLERVAGSAVIDRRAYRREWISTESGSPPST